LSLTSRRKERSGATLDTNRAPPLIQIKGLILDSDWQNTTKI
jgi:hypothetical protein